MFDIWNKSQPFLGKAIGLILGDLYYLETMILRIEEAKNVNNKRVLRDITLLWLMKVYLNDDYVDGLVHEDI